MGCCGSKEERPQTVVSTIRTPAQLGYRALPIGDRSPDATYCFYEFTLRLTASEQRITVARLGVSLHPGEEDLLIIDLIATGQDPRGDRPQSGDIFLSFWNHVVRRDVSHIRRLQFSDVYERGLTSLNDQVCTLLHVHSLLLDCPSVLRSGCTEGERAAFQILKSTPFAKVTKRMISRCTQLADRRLEIVRFDYIQPSGHNPRGLYDFMITLGR